MEESKQLLDSIERLNSNLERLISILEKKSGIAHTPFDGLYHEAETLRNTKLQNVSKLRNKVRTKSEIEIQGAVPFVVKCLLQNKTYMETAELARQAGFQFSNQSVARFYQNIAVSKIEGGRIYVVLKCGDTYEIDTEHFEIVATTGKI